MKKIWNVFATSIAVSFGTGRAENVYVERGIQGCSPAGNGSGRKVERGI